MDSHFSYTQLLLLPEPLAFCLAQLTKALMRFERVRGRAPACARRANGVASTMGKRRQTASLNFVLGTFFFFFLDFLFYERLFQEPQSYLVHAST